MEIRTRYRAVTAEDFEFLVRRGLAARRARASACRRRRTAACRVHIVPRVDARRPAAGAAHELIARRRPADARSREYLDERRLIGTTVELRPCALPRRERRRQPAGRRGAPTSRASSRTSPTRSTPTSTRSSAARSTGSAPAGSSAARSTRASSTASSHAVDGVDFVKILRVYETDLATGEQQAQAGGQLPRARARRADRLGQAHRQGRARGG